MGAPNGGLQYMGWVNLEFLSDDTPKKNPLDFKSHNYDFQGSKKSMVKWLTYGRFWMNPIDGG